MDVGAQDNMLERVRRINWFENCGKRSDIQVDSGIRLMYVDSLEEAIKHVDSGKWSNVTLEANNQLTSYLHAKFRDDYQKWNLTVKKIKSDINIDDLVFVKGLGLSELAEHSMLNSTRWNILAVLMADAYRESKHRQRFFLNLLAIYEAGHLPCGWIGKSGYNCDLTQGVIRVY